MTQVLAQAKQGDIHAIATLLNRSLNAQGIKVKVVRQNNTLKILLESLAIPDQRRFTLYVIQGLQQLGIPDQQIELYGKCSGDKGFAWIEKFQATPGGFTSPNSAPPQPVQSDPTTSEQATQPTNAAITGSTTPSDTAPAESTTAASEGTTPAHLTGEALIERAKAGDLQAIEAFVQSVLADCEELDVFVTLQETTLKVTLQTKQFLDGPAFCGELGGQLETIASEHITDVEFYKRKGENAMGFLMKQATIWHGNTPVAEPEPESLPLDSDSATQSTSPNAAAVSQMRPNGQSSAMPYQEPAKNYKRGGSHARPTSISVIAILYFVLGALEGTVGFFAILGGIALSSAMHAQGLEAQGAVALGGMFFVLGFLIIAISVGRIIVGFGLTTMKKWSRIGVLILEGLSILSAVIDIFQGKLWNVWKIAFAWKIIQTVTTVEESYFV